MKKLIIFFLCLSAVAGAQTRYNLSPGINKIAWEGKQALGGHTGTMNLISGFIIVDKNGQVIKGEFLIDVKSLHNDDNKTKATVTGFNVATEKDGLEEHLLGPDFFETEKYPTATFTFGSAVKTTTSVADQFKVTGLLTIKSITNSITFPAIIQVSGMNASLKAEIIFDRTKWDIVYKAEGFSSDLKDRLISNNIKVSLDLRLVKAQ